MNHVYKIIWNRARACWQVVSELAKSSGKVKSLRRQSRREGKAGGESFSRQLVATLAIAAVLMLGPAAQVEAAIYVDGNLNATGAETNATGALFYNYNYRSEFFTTVKNSLQSNLSGEFNCLVLAAGNGFNYNFTLTGGEHALYKPGDETSYTFPNGNKVIGGKVYQGYVVQSGPAGHDRYNNITWAQILGYDKIYVRVYNDDGTFTDKNLADYPSGSAGTTDLRVDINKYFQSAKYAQEIADAFNSDGSSDLGELLEHMPKFYGVYGTDEYGNELTDMLNAFMPLNPTTTIGNSVSGGSSGGFSYNNVTVGSGDTWRPMDRLKSLQVVSGDYTVSNGLWLNGDGSIVNDVYNSPDIDAYYNGLTGAWVSSGAFLNNYNNAKLTGNDSILVENGENPNYQPTVIKVNELDIGVGGVIDLAYLNTMPGGYLEKTRAGENLLFNPSRAVVVEEAQLADGTVLHFGSYGVYGGTSTNETKNTPYISSDQMDKLFITDATATGPDGHSTIYYELGYVAGMEDSVQGMAVREQFEDPLFASINLTTFLGILNGADQFTVEGRTSMADGIFSQYEITPVVGRWDDYFQTENSRPLFTYDAEGNFYTRYQSSVSSVIPSPDDPEQPFRAADPANLTDEERTYLEDQHAELSGLYDNQRGTAWYLESYSYIDTGSASESGKAAADSGVALNNLWRSNYLNMFKRTGTLHRYGFTAQKIVMPASIKTEDGNGSVAGAHSYPETIEDQKENAWVETYHGKYSSASGYGRSLDQSYNGIQAGYDKLLNREVRDGKMYNGFFVSKIDGKYNGENGSGGEQGSEGIGIYASWIGKKGHYLDASVMASRLSDSYHLYGNTGNGYGQVTGDYATWAYGLGLQYGYQSPVNAKGWFYEPSVSIFLGRVNGVSYELSNSLGINQDESNTATGRLGFKFGKQLANGKGNIYAGVAALHEFSGGAPVSAFWGNQTRALETSGGKDTWLEWSLGGNWQLSPAASFNLNFDKTTGGNTGNDWRINGGLNWTWGGFWGGQKSAKSSVDISESVTGDEISRRNTTLVIGRSVVAEVQEEQSSTAINSQPADQIQPSQTETQISPTDSNEVRPDTEAITNETEQTSSPTSSSRQANTTYSNPGSDYVLPSLTVEAVRPAWEKQLSPGQVSVVYPEQFEGEQKDLPDLLERVPGLFVQRVSGDGHYTVARVRGSTGAQVAVYVDGVLMNLNGEAAVNLSIIPVDNVERVEVYRGYVPARFSGSPLGGVINIVTKKPKDFGGIITQGFKSYGGYNSTYQFNTPAGKGSLLFTYQRDIWGGDFPFAVQPSGQLNNETYGDATRRSNSYQNNNGMVKWQDDKWMAKASWKDMREKLPRDVSNLRPSNVGLGGYTLEDFNNGYYDADLAVKQQEFQIGRRDTVGNLDWGWKAYYLHQKKDYENTGLLKYSKDNTYYWQWPGLYWTKYDSSKWGINLNGAMKIGNSHLVELNFDYSDESMDADGSNWDDWEDYITRMANGQAFWNRQYIRNYKIKEYHLTLQDSITLNQAGDFKLTPIVRADRVVMSTMSSNDMKWKYSGAVALQKEYGNWGLKTTWGTYNRHPNFYELFGDGATIMANDVSAKFFDIAGSGAWESGKQFDFGVSWQGRLGQTDTATSLTWFQRKSKNQLAFWQPGVPYAPGSYYPMDNAKVHGLELTHNMKWGRTGLELGGTWQKSEYSDNTINGVSVAGKSAISYTPEWVWNARLDYLFPGDRMNVFVEYYYTDKQFTGNYTGAAQEEYDTYLDAIGTVNLGFKYSFNKGWKLSAGVNDVFNKGYGARQLNGTTVGGGYHINSATRAYPLPGRMYYATMEYKF